MTKIIMDCDPVWMMLLRFCWHWLLLKLSCWGSQPLPVMLSWIKFMKMPAGSLLWHRGRIYRWPEAADVLCWPAGNKTAVHGSDGLAGWNYRNPLTVIQKNTRWILLLMP